MARVRFIADLLRRFRSGFFFNFFGKGKSKRLPKHLRLGARGEKMAARFLRKNGFKILYRNFRTKRGGEIDIVCRDGETLVFVEVKTRSSTKFGNPADAVNAEKQRLITRGAQAWLRLLAYPEVNFRFDILEIVVSEAHDSGDGKPRFNLIRDAFQLPERLRF